MTNSLLEKISNVEYLFHAWDKLEKSNKDSHGLSGETIGDFAANLSDKISSISKQIKNDAYRFRPYRPVVIRKDNGKFRPLQIPEISDRILLKAIAIELEEQFNDLIKKSEGISFAYQKKMGIKDAIKKVEEHFKKGNNFILKADLINFFGEVNKDELINNIVLPQLPDTSLNNLIIASLNQRVAKVEELIDKEKRSYFDNINTGIPQGNALSPLLSNIYLSRLDLHLKEKQFNLVRYADDFVVICPSKKHCINAHEECCKILNSLKLKIHGLEETDKTKIVDLTKETITFLSITFDGISFYPSRSNVDKFKNRINEVCNGKQKHSVSNLLTKINNKLDGWISAFYYTNLERYCTEIDYHINRQLYLSLSRLDWKFSSKSLDKLPHKFRKMGKSHECISESQRISSGIPLSFDLLKKKRGRIMTENNLIPDKIVNLSS